MSPADLSPGIRAKRMRFGLAAKDDLILFAVLNTPRPEHLFDPSYSRYEWLPHHYLIAENLQALAAGRIKRLEIELPPRHGKACCHDTPVLTPKGWSTHGKLMVGDYVFSPDGNPVKVTALSREVQEVVPVTLSNGETIYCHPNHEWTVLDRRRHAWRTLETRTLAEDIWINPKGKRGSRARWQLPDAVAVRFSKKNLPLHPYVLGAWLGDGSAGSTRIAHASEDFEVVNEIERLGYEKSGHFVQPWTGVHYTTFAGSKNNGSYFQKALVALKVIRNKHIPEIYLRGSVEQRKELIAGLVDTDGYVDSKGRVKFSTCSSSLRDGVFDLASTLGYRPEIVEAKPGLSSSGIQGRQVVYQVCFQPHDSFPTRIPRKRIAIFGARRRVSISSIGNKVYRLARSITVDSEDGLYLVGKLLNPTHNTELGVRNFVPWMAGKFPRKSGIVVTHTDTLAKEHGRDCRDYWRGPGFALVFGQNSQGALREDSQASDRLQTRAGGTVTFSGRGGLGAGVGADWMVFDDFFKNSQEAQSETVRNEAWRTFVADCQTRLNNEDCPVLMIGSRRHEDDVQGRLFDPTNPHYDAKEAAKWVRIRIPALSEGPEKDALQRPKDTSLWPAKFSADFYIAKKQHKSDIVRIDFETQDQCNPSPLEGTWIKEKWLKTYSREQMPKHLRYYTASDHAYRAKQKNDSNCILNAGMDPTGALYIQPDTFWGKCETDKLVDEFFRVLTGPRRPAHWWAARDAISGSILPFLRRRQIEEKVFFWIDDTISESTDLVARSTSIRGMMAMGLVYWPDWWPQWPDVRKQLLSFPSGSDDVVAALAMMGMGLDRMIKATGPKPDNTPPKGTFAWHSMGQEEGKKSWF